MNNAQSEINDRIAAFAQDMTAMLTRAVNDAVASSVGNAARTGRGRPASNAASSNAPKRRGRPPSVSHFDSAALFAEIKKTGGRRSEELAKALRTSTKRLTVPLKQLVADKKIKVEGKARGTKYSAR